MAAAGGVKFLTDVRVGLLSDPHGADLQAAVTLVNQDHRGKAPNGQSTV